MDFRDLAVAARARRKSPVLALTVPLTIALGVGASTAIFNVTNAALPWPLPCRHLAVLLFGTELNHKIEMVFAYANLAVFVLGHKASE
jgi:hypothetical protein